MPYSIWELKHDVLEDVRKGNYKWSANLSSDGRIDRLLRRDMDMALDKVIPEDLDWLHTDEGPE